MFVFAAPGQGAQSPGFLSPWLELPGFAERLAAWSDIAGCDLIASGTTAGADEIRDTAVAQPLLVAAAIATAEALCGDLGQARREGCIAAGHSVGELAAGAIAGVLTPEEAMRLVAVRSKAMARAAAVEDTGMTAILGGAEPDVLAAIEACGLTPANINAPGQIVAAGTRAQLDALAASPPARTRLRPLSVAGAFHSPHMAPATEALRDAAADWPSPIRRSSCCPTSTAPPSPRAPTGWSGSSSRSAPPCGGRSACAPWPAWARAPWSSSCPVARWPAWPNGPCRGWTSSR